ncbi:MAG: hypothetical protein WC076_03965 [Terrimicrobiaceae bacterium]
MKKFTLLADGTSDRALLSVLRWMLSQHHGNLEWIGQTAEVQNLPKKPKGLAGRIRATLELFPADVLFVHRDAEKESPDRRREEIASAFSEVKVAASPVPIPVIPVRMTESWLLISEAAIRGASGNPGGRIALQVPAIRNLEGIPDPKEVLKNLLIAASELKGRRRKKFHFPEHRARVPDFIEDWSVILQIPSAARVYDDIASLEFHEKTIASSP